MEASKRDFSLRGPTHSPREGVRGKQEANGKEKVGSLRSK
jgi:hypothetical protein